MAYWNKTKVDFSEINDGKMYEKNDSVSREQLNAIVNSAYYSQSMVEDMGNSGEYINSRSYRYPNIVTYDGSSYMAIYKDGTGEYKSFSGVVPNNSLSANIFWKLIASKGATGNDGTAGATFVYNESTQTLTITTIEA